MIIIPSESRPLCDLCGSSGTLAQTGVADPDGNISGSWGFQHCTNPSCGVYWLDPAPPPEELWRAYATYHTHTRKAKNRVARSMLSLAHRLIKISQLPLRMLIGLKREDDYLRFMTLKNEPTGKMLT